MQVLIRIKTKQKPVSTDIFLFSQNVWKKRSSVTSLLDVAGKTSMNFHISTTNFPRFSMIQAKTYKLIFCLLQANFITFFPAIWKVSMNFAWNLKNLPTIAAILFERFCTNAGKFSMLVSKNACNQVFVIVII